MGEHLIVDLETNGLKPSQIWVVGVLDLETDEYTAYTGEFIPEGLLRVADAERVVGHNVRKYDAAVIKKLSDGIIEIDNDKIDDTLEISRKLFPEMPNHKLETWGEILGSSKIKYDKGFDKFHPEMLPYCEQDVRLTAKLYRTFLAEIAKAA